MKKLNRHLYIGKYILLLGIVGMGILGIGNITHAADWWFVAKNQDACDTCKTNYKDFAKQDRTAEGETKFCEIDCAPAAIDPTTNTTTNKCTEAYKTATDGATTDREDCLTSCDASADSEDPTQFDSCKSSCQTTYDATVKSAKDVNDLCDPNVYTSEMWITINPSCLKNWQCKFNIYELLGIKRSSDPTVFVQDILLSATFFIGTVITIALIYSGILYIMAGTTGKDPASAKSGMKNSIIGLVIVICSYSIIRLVQYIAKGF